MTSLPASHARDGGARGACPTRHPPGVEGIEARAAIVPALAHEADVAQTALEVAPEVLREDGVKDGVGGGVDVSHHHDEDEEVPGLGKLRGGESVVQEVHLVRGVADGVHHHAGHQHLHHALASPDGVGRAVSGGRDASAAASASPAVAASAPVERHRRGVRTHLKARVQLLRAGVQALGHHAVQRHLHDERQEVEQEGLQQLEDQEVAAMGVWEDDLAVVGVRHGRKLRQAVEGDGGGATSQRHGPDDGDDVEDFPTSADDVSFHRKDYGDEPRDKRSDTP